MRKLNPEELTLVVSLYRSFRSNPKEFKLSTKAKESLLNIVDKYQFDINEAYAPAIAYDNYLTGYFLEKEVAKGTRGEDYRNVEKAIYEIKGRLAHDMIREIRNGNIPDEPLIVAAYLHIGIAYNLIPKMKQKVNRSRAWNECNEEDHYVETN